MMRRYKPNGVVKSLENTVRRIHNRQIPSLPSNRSMTSLKEGFNHANETIKGQQGFISSRLELCNRNLHLFKETNNKDKTLINKEEIVNKV